MAKKPEVPDYNPYAPRGPEKAPGEPSAAQASNSKELTPNEKAALRMHHVRKLLDIAEELKPIFEKRTKARALAKADGFKLSEIDAAIRLSTMEDPNIFVEEIKELIEIAKAFNALPPGEQGSLFPDRRPGKEKAFDEGKVAGLAGKNPEPPYGADSDKGQAWMEGWHAGQAIMRDDLQTAMEKRNAAKSGDELIRGEGADPEFPDPDNQNGEHAEAAE